MESGRNGLENRPLKMSQLCGVVCGEREEWIGKQTLKDVSVMWSCVRRAGGMDWKTDP